MFEKPFQHGKKTCSVTAICLLLASPSAFAAQQPDAGNVLKNTQENELKAPNTVPTNITIQEGNQPSSTTGGETLSVAKFHIIGQDVFPEAELTALLTTSVGKQRTLGELGEDAACISRYFRDHGYLMARAFIPAQESKDGELAIEVVVGRYGQIDIRNHSRLATSYIQSVVSPLKSGEYIRQDNLERVLLLLGDHAGVSFKNTMAPGKEAGTADLILEVTDGTSMTGQVYSDNWGNRFTGDIRGGLNVTLNNPGTIGDSLMLGGLYTGSGLNNWSAAYSLPTGPEGARFGVSYSRVSYLLGENYTDLHASGISKTTSVYETYPLLRSRSKNLNIRLSYDHKELNDQTVNSDSKKQANAITFSVNGDYRDQAGDGITGFDLGVSSGHLNLNSEYARTSDAMTQTAGDYTKTTLSIMRQKYLNSRLNYSLFLTSQLASKNLDSSEKLSLGGASGVRAYPQGEASGDTGYLVTGELRWNMPSPEFQLVAFLDNGHVTLNKNQVSTGSNSRTLTGAGLGMVFNRPGDYSVRLDYAFKVGSESAQSDTDKNGRFWVRASKYF